MIKEVSGNGCWEYEYSQEYFPRNTFHQECVCFKNSSHHVLDEMTQCFGWDDNEDVGY